MTEDDGHRVEDHATEPSDGGPPRAIIAVAVALGVSILALVATMALFDAYKVPSASMEPTIEPGDRMLVRMSGAVGIGRGDIAVYRGPPGEFPAERVSRVVALGGERVEVSDGKVLVDGSPLEEPYLPEGASTPAFPKTVVPEDAVFLLSDNRGNARDSGMLGPIERNQLVGRVSLIDRPLDYGLMVLCGALGLALVVLAVRRSRRQVSRSGA